MSLNDIHTIDAVGEDKTTGQLVLNIVDGWDWVDAQSHLTALQSKLNSYLAFVEGGQIDEIDPSWNERGAMIYVVFRHPPPDSAIALLKTAEFVAQSLKVSISHSVHTD